MKEDSWPFSMGLIGSSETSVINYLHLLRNNPEERILSPRRVEEKFRWAVEPVWIFWRRQKNLLLMLNKRPLRYEGENRFSMVSIRHVEIERYKKGCREMRKLPIYWRLERDIYVLLKRKGIRGRRENILNIPCFYMYLRKRHINK
jgi:hypothetical protein